MLHLGDGTFTCMNVFFDVVAACYYCINDKFVIVVQHVWVCFNAIFVQHKNVKAAWFFRYLCQTRKQAKLARSVSVCKFSAQFLYATQSEVPFTLHLWCPVYSVVIVILPCFKLKAWRETLKRTQAAPEMQAFHLCAETKTVCWWNLNGSSWDWVQLHSQQRLPIFLK